MIVLAEYLKSREVEVKNIMHTLFDQQRIDELNQMDITFKMIKNLMDSCKWTIEQAMKALKIPESDYSKYIAML